MYGQYEKNLCRRRRRSQRRIKRKRKRKRKRRPRRSEKELLSLDLLLSVRGYVSQQT
jgi:hypothetical protein